MAVSAAFLVRAWYSDAAWLRVLRPLEWCYRGAVALRRAAYSSGVLSSYRPPLPVVVVGNITVGGTGKTPVVISLVEELRRLGIRAGVVSRGYGASGRDFPHTVDADSRPAECGEEALLVRRRTQCPCVVAPSRVAAVKALLRDFAVDVIVCDDGLQHYALDRDLQIVMYDARTGFGNGHCLPAGPLREPLQALDSVDFVLARGLSDHATGVHYRVDGLFNLRSGERREPSPAIVGTEVYAIAGVGQPEYFFDSLRAQGFTLHTRVFSDHYRYRAQDFAALTDKPILMTEKDAVKCHSLVGDNAWYLKVSAILPETVITAVASLVKH